MEKLIGNSVGLANLASVSHHLKGFLAFSITLHGWELFHTWQKTDGKLIELNGDFSSAMFDYEKNLYRMGPPSQLLVYKPLYI